MPFLRRGDASIGHHTPLITLFTCSSSRATTLINNATGIGSPENIFCRAELTSYHRTSLTAVQALGLFGIIRQPQASPHQHIGQYTRSAASILGDFQSTGCNASIGMLPVYWSSTASNRRCLIFSTAQCCQYTGCQYTGRQYTSFILPV